MPWKKGESGNRKGRPPVNDSLAAQIRDALTPAHRKNLFIRMMAIACEPHDDPRSRVAAAEWLAKHGWPEEAKGNTTTVKAENGNVTVIHEHHES